MRLFSRTTADVPVPPETLVLPRATIDGWTLEGTPLASRLPRGEQRELCTLLHGVAVEVDTPYTYARAMELLEALGELGQAHAVGTRWLAGSAAGRVDGAHQTRAIARQTERLRVRLSSSGRQVAPGGAARRG